MGEVAAQQAVREEVKDWAEALVPRTTLELQQADVVMTTLASLAASATQGTAAYLTAHARFEAASAWYTRCYIEWQQARQMAADRAKPTPAPAPNPVA